MVLNYNPTHESVSSPTTIVVASYPGPNPPSCQKNNHGLGIQPQNKQTFTFAFTHCTHFTHILARPGSESTMGQSFRTPVTFRTLRTPVSFSTIMRGLAASTPDCSRRNKKERTTKFATQVNRVLVVRVRIMSQKPSIQDATTLG